ncbi:large subunit ribosomal protein L25 [Parabacteroides sp. PFB2-10]|uniref:50S ribosomal protein L25/general stress protein Ctc n=1 Tax=Parabacteroides sp. PFB2-10 TaxID=1742405 RepID=UPI00247620E8|nr:50S ribosomal protein L25/general stress protein Ctc [Parabacteroides sp. PFB2-10]MDH6313517.1 large subunit ribosomal protein L25 [Parabacteroides sp. PFB2-10]MDL2244358.1 50S ribosomal protein L25/general stress protein Ctc [Parabacteroides sp. OttesenSCG-928-J18]
MKTFALEAKSRTIAACSADQKRGLKNLRKNKEVPAVLYGGNEVVHLSITQDALRNLVYTPKVYLVELSVDGNKKMAIVKDMQFQPVTDELLHIDFLEIAKDKPVIIEVPVALEGYAEGVKAGGKLTLRMRKLKVKALYENLPEKLVINVDKLGLGKSMQIGELQFEGLELMNAKNAVVCTVQLTRAARGAAAAAATAKK